MAKLTISAISTLSAIPTRPPKFDVEPNPNMMPTSQEKAPVLLTIKSDETIDAEKFTELFAAECEHFDVVEAARRISAVGEVIADCAAECQNVQLGFANLEVNVTGTIPDTNAPLNDANVAEYIAVESAAVRRQFAQIETHIPTSVTPADMKRIRDVATGDNKIHGNDPFFIQGLKLTQGGAGEKVELMNEGNTEKIADVEVLDGSSEISLKVKLASKVEAGRYYLLVTTLAGGDTTLYPVGQAVTVVDGSTPVEPGPHITSLKSRTTGGEGEWRIFRDTLDIKGYGFDEDTTATLRLLDGEEELAAMTSNKSGKNVLTRESDGKLVFAIDVNETEMTDGAWEDASYDVELVLKNSKGEARLMLIKRVNA